MSVIRNVLNIIYSAYAIALFFVVLFLLMFPYAAVFFMNDRTRTLAAYRANKILITIWFKLCGYKVIVEGAEKIDPAKTYVFVSNHTNMLDAPVTAYYMQHYFKTLIKKELIYVPFFGFLMTVVAVTVDRSNAESRRRSTQIIVDKLSQGISFFIFPEGTRNRTGQPLKSFHSGAFKTAVMAGVAVQPVVCLDLRGLQPVGTYRLHPGTIRVKILDAIETKGMTSDQAEALQERVHKAMEQVILTEDKDFASKVNP